MTFAEGVLRLVEAGVRVGRESRAGSAHSHRAPLEADAPAPPGPALDELAAERLSRAAPDVAHATADATPAGAVAGPSVEPGFADIEAAVALVGSGLARRVVLTGFQSWPGLLWQAYQLAAENDVLILPTVVRPGGRVDVVVVRDADANG